MSTITAEGSVNVTGQRAAAYSNITAKNVRVYGSYGVSYTNIIQIANESLTVSLYGYNSGYQTNIYCLNGTICTIKCNINIACNSTTIYYSNLDYVNIYPSTCKNNTGTINNEGIYCPYLIDSFME